VNGMIFDVQGHSVHDGPGCRTLVFLSGCPLRCAWCANPEGQLARSRVMYRVRRCVPTCERCVDACPSKAIRRDRTTLRFDRSLCERCDDLPCAQACLDDALQVAGRIYTVDDVMRILTRDQGFWDTQGGVTFSGGEPLFQREFITSVLDRCRLAYIHTAVETCAMVDTEFLLQLLGRIDWLFVDLKHMDSRTHRAGTGVGNELILHNIQRVAESGWDGRLVIRVPIVPGFNDGPENLRATAKFVRRLNLEVNILPFHRLGNSKYEQLGLTYRYAETIPLSQETMRAVQRIFEASGLHCDLGSETPY
jgi:pyruvate formate lyase activating enzyme